MVRVVTLSVVVLACGALGIACGRSDTGARPSASISTSTSTDDAAGIGRKLSEGPVETVPRARGGGPPVAKEPRENVPVDDAGTRRGAAECSAENLCAKEDR